MYRQFGPLIVAYKTRRKPTKDDESFSISSPPLPSPSFLSFSKRPAQKERRKCSVGAGKIDMEAEKTRVGGDESAERKSGRADLLVVRMLAPSTRRPLFKSRPADAIHFFFFCGEDKEGESSGGERGGGFELNTSLSSFRLFSSPNHDDEDGRDEIFHTPALLYLALHQLPPLKLAWQLFQLSQLLLSKLNPRR